LYLFQIPFDFLWAKRLSRVLQNVSPPTSGIKRIYNLNIPKLRGTVLEKKLFNSKECSLQNFRDHFLTPYQRLIYLICKVSISLLLRSEHFRLCYHFWHWLKEKNRRKNNNYFLNKKKKGKSTSGNMILLFKRNLSPIITYFWTNSKGKKELKNRIPLKWFNDFFCNSFRWSSF